MCRAFEPTWDEVSSEFRGKVDFKRVNIGDPDSEKLVRRYGVGGAPVFIFADGAGQEVDIIGGAPSDPDVFRRKIQSVLKKFGG